MTAEAKTKWDLTKLTTGMDELEARIAILRRKGESGEWVDHLQHTLDFLDYHMTKMEGRS